MIGLVIDICKNVIDFVVKRNEINSETKEKISIILNEIADILQDTADKISKDEYPHMNCVVMKRLADKLHFQLIDYVEAEDLDNLHKSLVQASELEQLFNVRKEPDTIKSILESAAEFKALSLLIKI